MEEPGGASRLHQGQQAAIPATLPTAGHPLCAASREGRQGPFSVRDGYRHWQNAYGSCHHQVVFAFRQREARSVSGGPPGTGRPGQESVCGGVVCRFPNGHLQREQGRLAAGGDRRHHGPVPPVQQQIPTALFTNRFRPGHIRRSAPLDWRQCPRCL